MSAKNLSRIQIQKNGSMIITDFWASLVGTMEKFCDLPQRVEATTTAKIGILDYGKLFGEEPPIQGLNGTSAFYIHGCPFKCATCYQPEFFDSSARSYISSDELASAMLLSEENGASSILIVIATYQEDIFDAIKSAKNQGLTIPIVYKFAGKLSSELLKKLFPYVSVFVPDLKAVSSELMAIHGLTRDYLEGNISTLRYLIDSGSETIVRHLIVPSHQDRVGEVKTILSLLDLSKENASLSLLTQFYDRPTGRIFSANTSEVEEMKRICRRNGCTVYVQKSDGTYDF